MSGRADTHSGYSAASTGKSPFISSNRLLRNAVRSSHRREDDDDDDDDDDNGVGDDGGNNEERSGYPCLNSLYMKAVL